MRKLLRIWIFMVLLCLCSGVVSGKDMTREQLKGLDEQIQEIKSDVLAIATELNQLEEKLLYPSNTEMAIFMAVAEGEKFRLDSVEIQVDGKPVAYHLYSFKELEALQKGGVQRVYTGNVKTGAHDLQVSFKGKSKMGGDIEHSQSFKVNKRPRPAFVEITLTQSDITLNDR
jgi:hypothetical protein